METFYCNVGSNYLKEAIFETMKEILYLKIRMLYNQLYVMKYSSLRWDILLTNVKCAFKIYRFIANMTRHFVRNMGIYYLTETI